MAVERLKTCDNIVELSQELGVHRRLLYKWRDQFDPFDSGEESPPGNSCKSTLRTEINQLKRGWLTRHWSWIFSKTGMNQVWIADITYARLKKEFVYLAVMLEAFSRNISVRGLRFRY